MKSAAKRSKPVKKAAKPVNVLPLLPKHVQKMVDDIIGGLQESCGDDDAKLRLLLNDPEHRKVAKIAKDPLTNWSLGYLRGVADTFRIESEELLHY